MAAAMMILGTLPGVDRPAIASLVPASDGFALLIDAGANTDVRPLNLAQFAVMGSVYSRRVRGVPNPRSASWPTARKNPRAPISRARRPRCWARCASRIDYIGYVEGRDINRGKADVVVTDGFTGNVALKTMEGFASFLLGNLRDVFGTIFGRIAYLLVRKRLGGIRERLDPSEYGGAPLLGLDGVTIIAHGSSNPRAIRNAIRAAANEALVERVNAEIVEMLKRHVSAMPAKSTNKGFRALLGRMRERLHRHPRDGAAPQAQTTPAAAAAPATGHAATPPAVHAANSEHASPPAPSAPGTGELVAPDLRSHEVIASGNGFVVLGDASHDEPPKSEEEKPAVESPPTWNRVRISPILPDIRDRAKSPLRGHR